MAVKHLVGVIFVLGCLAWRSSASHDEDSATKKLDELFEIISNSLAGNDKCQDTDLPGDCTITSDCLKITCNAHFGGKTITLTVKVNRCDEPVTVTINVKVKGDDVDWTHVFTSGDELAVPGLGIDVKGVAKAGLFIRVKLEPDDNILTVKVILEGGTKVGSVTFFPLKMTMVTQKLPISTAYCGFVRWWEARNTAVRIVLVLVFLLLVLSIITGFNCCCCCCCCCRPCRRKRSLIII